MPSRNSSLVDSVRAGGAAHHPVGVIPTAIKAIKTIKRSTSERSTAAGGDVTGLTPQARGNDGRTGSLIETVSTVVAGARASNLAGTQAEIDVATFTQ